MRQKQRPRGGRSAPYRAKCPATLGEVLRLAGASRFCLVQEEGPVSFILRPHGTRGATRRVQIGDPHRCTCGARDLCVHVLWVLMRVYRIPPDSPLLWQCGLVDAELTAVLGGALAVRQQRREDARRLRREAEAARRAPGPPLDARSSARRRGPALDDLCPVCCEELGSSEGSPADPVDWCRAGCGNWVHVHCLAEWAQHRAPLPATCPYCRAVWEPPRRDTMPEPRGPAPWALRAARSWGQPPRPGGAPSPAPRLAASASAHGGAAAEPLRSPTRGSSEGAAVSAETLRRLREREAALGAALRAAGLGSPADSPDSPGFGGSAPAQTPHGAGWPYRPPVRP
eukprot:TRINITY_DN47610_c0_g1_i1.p2 TRINITY_DN47610_c0_g1~~TRINITY_DN47610_c0_g1_i1.p2  ORF type:complete len:342 (+),score=70.14 TRINITY_DN47610_c0_g1_i1:107-1132(+)